MSSWIGILRVSILGALRQSLPSSKCGTTWANTGLSTEVRYLSFRSTTTQFLWERAKSCHLTTDCFAFSMVTNNNQWQQTIVSTIYDWDWKSLKANAAGLCGFRISWIPICFHWFSSYCNFFFKSRIFWITCLRVSYVH